MKKERKNHTKQGRQAVGYFLWSWPWYVGGIPREQDLEEGDSGVEATWQLKTAALFLLQVRDASENLIKALNILSHKNI